jgi:hypothetical protein
VKPTGKKKLGTSNHGRIIFKWTSMKENGRVWTRFILLRKETRGRLLCR